MFRSFRAFCASRKFFDARIPAVFQNHRREVEFFLAKYGGEISARRMYCVDKIVKDKSDFGSLSFSEHEKVEMDEAEKIEEEFTENEARIPRRFRMSPGKYADLIKSHIGNVFLD